MVELDFEAFSDVSGGCGCNCTYGDDCSQKDGCFKYHCENAVVGGVADATACYSACKTMYGATLCTISCT
jgi:hypothetical protein